MTMISEKDAKQRINRRLRPYLHALIPQHGRYYVVDRCRDLISDHDVDLEIFGRELGVIGVIAPLETVDRSTLRCLIVYPPTTRTYFTDWVTARNFGRWGIDRQVIERLLRLLGVEVHR